MSKKKNVNIIENPDKFVEEMTAIDSKRTALIEQGFKSKDPDLVLKANEYLQGRVAVKGLQNPKSMIVDPIDFNSYFKYKAKPTQLSYEMLRRMSRTPIVSSIIATRLIQASRFTDVAPSRFDIGFQIVLRDSRKQPDKQDLKNMDEITQAILDGGFGGYSFGRDDFTDFIKKLVRDSLQYDQMTFEVLEDKRGIPREWIATDAATYRVVNFDENDKEVENQIEYFNDVPYRPAYAQLNQNGDVHEYFYPWEMCFGVRNPRTDLKVYGYGYSELEDMVDTITSMLWADEYNRRFFSHGSAPKGIIKVNGVVNEDKMREFKRDWMAQMAGVYNSWKTPIMYADKMEWIDLMKSNREMEYKEWLNYNIKLACAKFCISPVEIGFDLKAGDGAKPLFESSNSSEIKYSFDKGLTPMMVYLQSKINRYIVWRIDSRYSFKFYGINTENRNDVLDRAIKEVANFKTIDEVRAYFDLKPLGKKRGGNLILNSVWYQWLNNKEMKDDQERQQMIDMLTSGGQGGPGYENQMGAGEQPPPNNPGEGDANNPFQKALVAWYQDNLIEKS